MAHTSIYITINTHLLESAVSVRDSSELDDDSKELWNKKISKDRKAYFQNSIGP